MSSQKILSALGVLQSDAENETGWLELQDAVTAPDTGMSSSELADLLESARREHELRREWSAVAELLDLEISLRGGTPQEGVLQAELARVLEDELLDEARAIQAYRRLLIIRPNDPTATEALERAEEQSDGWRAAADQNIEEAKQSDDPALRGSMLAAAAEVIFRHGRSTAGALEEALALLQEAVQVNPKNRRACLLLERILHDAGRWEDVSTVLETIATEASSRDERFAALVRLARIAIRKLSNQGRAVAAYERALDLSPGYGEAMNFLADFFSRNEKWEHLVALYEDQLRSGTTKSSQELGIWLQIAMVQWRMRERSDLAEPYFDKVRRVEPTHPGMLDFYRNWCADPPDPSRLMAILTDAQRALSDGEAKATIGTEIAKLAETQEDAHKAIDQYKSLLRQDPDNSLARASLKRLFRQTEAWTSLIDVLRQELERSAADDKDQRLLVLREIAEVYRNHIKMDSALVTVLGQIIQLDDRDIDAVRELCRVYETLQRWRDLLIHQQKLAELSEDREEKISLLRQVGRRWIEQFQNVQNATEVFEELFKLDTRDEEARTRLKELYGRRRAWPQMYSLYEREVEHLDDAAKLPVYVEMAKLAAERLDRPADAIALYKKVLSLDPNVPQVMDSLEKQAEKDKDFETVAEVLEHRVQSATDENTRINHLQKLGSVYSERLNDPKRAAGAWRRVLEIRPGQSRAQRVLRDAYLAAEDFDAITELYAQTEDWEGLAEVLSAAADKAMDPTTKVSLSFRVAEVFERRLATPERAFRAYERVLSAKPDDAPSSARAAQALVPIYEKDERWARLPSLYEILLERSAETSEKLALLRKLAEVTGRRLSDKSAALVYARKAYDLAPEAEGALSHLEDHARVASSWEPFVQALEARLTNEKELPEQRRRELQLRLAHVYAEELGRLDDAVAQYRALVEGEPTDSAAVFALDRILRASNRQADLRWLFDLRVKIAQPEEAVSLLAEWAGLEEEVFGEPPRAVKLYQRTLKLEPSNENALGNLARLLIAAGDSASAVEVIETHRDLSSGQRRGGLDLSLAELYVGALERPADALSAVTRAIDAGLGGERAISVLDKLVAVAETKVSAANVLVSLHAALGQGEKEAAALAVLIDSSVDRGARLELLARLIEVYEVKLNEAGRALDVVLSALTEFPAELAFWDKAADLAAVAKRSTDLAEGYKHTLASATALPDAVEVDLCERTASLLDEQLGDQDGAIPYLERVLTKQPANDRAFLRLKQILTGRERWADLEALYGRAVTGTTNSDRRMELLAEVAIICEEIIESATKAIDYYERILDIDSLHVSATSALEKLYASEKCFEKLVALLERRLATATQAETIEIKLRLGSLHMDQLNVPENALPHVEDVLRSDANQHEARQLAERMLAVPSLRAKAAEVLEYVYETRAEVRDLVRVLDIRLEGASDNEQRKDLLRRIATLRDERLADDAGAIDALAKLLPMDPVDVQTRSRLVEIGRRVGAHERVATVLTEAAQAAPSTEVRGTILMEVASIYRDHLGDVSRAEGVYRKVLEIDPTDVNLVLPAARALQEIYAGLGNHRALVEMLRTEVKLEDTPDRRAEIYARLGEICESILEDLPGSIEAWKARLADNPSDESALAALERLYEKVGAWRELVEILRTREQNTTDGNERRRLMTRTAQTLMDKLLDVSEAITAWRAVADEFGHDRTSLKALEGLYEKAERWSDLAETLDSDLNQVEDSNERLAILVRLGDVRRVHQEDLPGALESYRQALTLDPAHVASRGALTELLTVENARRDAAQILHPLYEADGDHERLLRVVEIEAQTAFSPDERLELLEQAVRVAEGPLSDASRAFDFAIRGLVEAAGAEDVRGWLDRVERLATSTRRFPELVKLLREVVGQILAGDVQLDVTLRIAELARNELADRDLARDYYVRALDMRGDERRALEALEKLYEEAGDAAALLDIIRRRVEVAEHETEKKQLLFRQAKLCSEVLEDRDGAIAVYEALLDIDLDPAAVAALEELYRKAERPNDLIVLYERQLDRNPADKAELRVRIARVAEGSLNDPDRAFDELAEALAIDSQHEATIRELERLLVSAADPEHRARAAQMLEPYYLARAEWKRVKVTIEARLISSQDPDKRRELLRRLAMMQEEQEEDFLAALETTAKLLHEDVADQETWRQLESQARVAGAERRLAEIFAAELAQVTTDEPATAQLARRTGELFASLGDVDQALLFYRRALDFEPESEELFAAIDKLLIKADRSEARVGLYRAALDHRFEPSLRLNTLHTIAGLLRGPLGKADEAIDTYRAALDVDERDVVALDALTELFRAQARYTELAELYLRRAEAEEHDDKYCGYRLALARLRRDQLSDISGAIDEYEEIVRRMPSHTEAISDLEALMGDVEHKGRIVEILLPIYEGADDWRKQIQVNAQRFELAKDELERVAILRDTARLWELRGGDAARAFGALRIAFESDWEDSEIRSELERLAADLGAWDELAEAYEKALVRAQGSAKRDLLAALAAIHDERRDDPRQALIAYERLHALDESDPSPLEKMDFLAMLLADWQMVVRVLTKQAELIGSDEDRASVWRRVGEAKRDMIEDVPGAIRAYEQAVELEPTSAHTVDRLIDLYEQVDDARRLVELYQRRVELTDDDQSELKFNLLVQAADRMERQLRDRQGSIEALRQALEVRPADSSVLRKLELLYRAEAMWTDLLETLRLEASSAESTESRVRLRREIGKLLAGEIGEPADALEAFRMVLEEAPTDEESVEAVRAIGAASESHRLAAAEILEPVLRQTSKYEVLVSVLEMRLTAQSEASDRATTLRSIGRVLDESLGNTSDALGAMLRAMAETPEDGPTHQEIERLAAASSGFGRYADALAERASGIFEAVLSCEMWTRLGKVAEEKLSNDARAVEAYSKALEQSGDAPALLEALDRLHARLGNAQQLAEILERRVSVEEQPEMQADLYHRLATLQIKDFGDKVQGLETLRMALSRAPNHAKACEAIEALTEDKGLFEEASTVLESVYRARGDFKLLAALYQKRVAFASEPSDRLRMRLDLARVLEDQASDPKAAQRVIEDALSDDPCDGEVLSEVERLATMNSQWTEASKALASVLEQSTKLDSHQARDLFARLAGWYRDKLADGRSAEKAFGEALSRDTESVELLKSIEELQREAGRERELIETLRRRAALEIDSEKRRDLYREAKVLAETVVHDDVICEKVLRELLSQDETFLWALEELTKLREKAEDYAEVVKLLSRRAELTDSAPEITLLKHQAAEVLRVRLSDNARALEVYEELFEMDSADRKASAALRELYLSEKKDQALAGLLEKLIDLATTPSDRTSLRLELAELHATKFNAADDAVEVLLRVLEEEPGHTGAVVALSQLYEKSGRDQDLADLLNSQIALARERNDSQAELTFTVRLGEIYESRLGDSSKAIETYQQVLARDANHSGALESLGRLFEAKGEIAKAAEILEKLLKLLEGEDAITMALRLAALFDKIKQDDGVRRALEHGLAIKKDSEQIRDRLRKLYEKTAAWAELASMTAEDAEVSADQATRIRLLKTAAEIHATKRNDSSAAAELLEKASAIVPDDRELLLLLCDAYSASGRGKDAVKALEKIVASYGGKRVKELADVHHRLAKAYLADGDKERGLTELDLAFKINPGNLAILVDLGRVAVEANDLERAQKTFRALLLQRLDEKAPITKAEVFYYLGDISNRQGDPKKAIQMLERAVETDASLQKAKDLLAQLKS